MEYIFAIVCVCQASLYHPTEEEKDDSLEEILHLFMIVVGGKRGRLPYQDKCAVARSTLNRIQR